MSSDPTGHRTTADDGSGAWVYVGSNGKVHSNPGNKKSTPDIGYGTDKHPTKQQIINYITKKCQNYGIPARIGLATAKQESDFTQFVRGKVYDSGGGYGIMQIQKSCHKEAFDGKHDLNGKRVKNGIDVANNWHDNVDYGVKILSGCYCEAKKYRYRGNDLIKATYSDYNSGSCSKYKKSRAVNDHVNKFWNHYQKQDW